MGSTERAAAFPFTYLPTNIYDDIGNKKEGRAVMLFFIVFALVVCIISFIVTIRAISTVDENYNMDRSLKNLSVIYIVIVPVVIVIIGFCWFLFA